MAAIDLQVLQEKFDKDRLAGAGMNERSLRRWAAGQANMLKRGGVAAVARITGLSRKTITKAATELRREEEEHISSPVGLNRIRLSGGGRRKNVEKDHTLLRDLALMLREDNKLSTRKLAIELNNRGHQVGYRTVAKLLHFINGHK
ncbi:MAG: hypothetical protein ACLPN1_10250 [Dissulfurispiraceae bacterium]